MQSFKQLLVANRGEIAVRVIRAAGDLGIATVAVAPEDDTASLHVSLADTFVQLPGRGPASYLDREALLEVAVATGCDAVHPGYGFLSEDVAFATACAARGLTFVGPQPELLELFGDKVRAREAAESAGVPVVPATGGSTTLAQAKVFLATHGPLMVKAVHGGGGRGMRMATDAGQLDQAWATCSREAQLAFGDGSLYVERLIGSARHIEVQILGDGRTVTHLGERDCTLQRRHQKLVEIAPSPFLSAERRQRVIGAALRLAGEVGYTSLGTFEFLVSPEGYWFIEANPRLQVEHTITEAVTSVDLVQSQLLLAAGATLAELGLDGTPALSGYAIQSRICLESIDADGQVQIQAGALERWQLPGGPGVRVDTHAYQGMTTSVRYDSLAAKLICHGQDFSSATARTARALAECVVRGVPSNVSLLRALVARPEFSRGDYDTTFVTTHLSELAAAAAGLERKDPDPRGLTTPGDPLQGPAANLPEAGQPIISAPLQGVVVELRVQPGQSIRPGQTVAVIEAMKMEHLVAAEQAAVVDNLLVSEGQAVGKDTPLLSLSQAKDSHQHLGQITQDLQEEDPDWEAEVAELARRRAIAREMGGEDKVARQHRAGKLTARERIDRFADPGTFDELGGLTAFANYQDDKLVALKPANFVTGTAAVGGRRIMLGVDDFTLRGGSGDGAVSPKQVFSEEYAGRMRLPVVRLLDGASGGGSVKTVLETGFHYLPVNPAWDAVVDNLSLVPVVALCLGPTVGLGAARLVMSHFTLMVRGLGQVFTAGPPVVLGGTGEDLTKEQLGGAQVHHDNAMIERVVTTEEEAFDLTRRFLAYLPDSVFSIPPVEHCQDDPARRDQSLLSAVPRNPRRPYAIWPIIEAIFDRASVLPFADYGGAVVTALARLDGHPVGVISTDPHRGATMSAEGAQATIRLVDLCETFHLPIISLTDQGGVSIGLEAERRGSIRYGARAITAIYQARVPQAEIVLRRVFGVGGAGMVNRHQPNRSWAWPSGNWGSLPAKGGVEAAFRAQLDQAADREAEIARLQREIELLSSPLRTAERFGVQDIIDPRESRPLLCQWVADAYRVLPELTGRPAWGTRP